MEYLGIAIALLGACFAMGICCVGSGQGTGMVGEAAAGVVAEDPTKANACTILQILPGTQGLYGLVIFFWAIFSLGFMSGDVQLLSTSQGIAFALACLPMALGGYFTAIAQARCAAAGVALVAKRGNMLSRGMMMAAIVEFYAILCLLASFLLINFLVA